MIGVKTKIDELKKIREAATQGEWQSDFCGDIFIFNPEAKRIMRLNEPNEGGVMGTQSPWNEGTPNSKFACAAANNWDNILEALEIACEALVEMKYTVARSGKLENTPFEDTIELQLQALSQIREKMGLSDE